MADKFLLIPALDYIGGALGLGSTGLQQAPTIFSNAPNMQRWDDPDELERIPLLANEEFKTEADLQEAIALDQRRMPEFDDEPVVDQDREEQQQQPQLEQYSARIQLDELDDQIEEAKQEIRARLELPDHLEPQRQQIQQVIADENQDEQDRYQQFIGEVVRQVQNRPNDEQIRIVRNIIEGGLNVYNQYKENQQQQVPVYNDNEQGGDPDEVIENIRKKDQQMPLPAQCRRHIYFVNGRMKTTVICESNGEQRIYHNA